MKYTNERMFVLLMIILFSISALGGMTEIAASTNSYENGYDVCHTEETRTWIICSDVPGDIGSAEQYTISGTLDYRFAYIKGSPVVMLHTKAGNELTMIPGAHYTLAEGSVEKEFENVEKKRTGYFSVSLTEAGIAYLTDNIASGENKPEVRIYFSAAPGSASAEGGARAALPEIDDSDMTVIKMTGMAVICTAAILIFMNSTKKTT